MTEPPYGDAIPPEGSVAPPSDGPQASYPRQQLLPQVVRPGRSRVPLLVGATALALVLVGGLLAWWLLRDNGEENRAAYCAAVRTLTHNGDLASAASGAVQNGPAALVKVRDLAPSTVKTQWNDVVSIVSHPSASAIDVATGLRLVSDLQVIAQDANAKCGLDITLPF